MPHGIGGGPRFGPKHSFDEALKWVGKGKTITSTTGEQIKVVRGRTADRKATLVFRGVNAIHGNVCSTCWGCTANCLGTLVGQCARPLDEAIEF